MTRNNYRKLTESRLREYASYTGRRIYNGEWPPNEGDLMLSDESGVKRLREAAIGDAGIASAVSDLGSGHSSWESLCTMLDGMCLAERLREDACGSNQPQEGNRE